MTDLDPRALRNAFGCFQTGVTVVTAMGAEGPIGFTANSFTSVSLDPPLVLVCLANSSSNYKSFTEAKGFAVNILSEAQKEVSNTFARPVEDRFAAVSWAPGPAGSPVFEGVSAWFDCTMFNQVEAGDHVVLIGQVKGFEATPAPGLGYARGAYVTPALEAEALRGSRLMISALIEQDGKVLLQDTGKGGLTLPELEAGDGGAAAALARLIEGAGLLAEPGFVYSVYEDAALRRQHITFLCQGAQGAPSQGVFMGLTQSTLSDVADPAMGAMLERFAREQRIGNFGTYLGDEKRGDVRRMEKGREA